MVGSEVTSVIQVHVPTCVSFDWNSDHVMFRLFSIVALFLLPGPYMFFALYNAGKKDKDMDLIQRVEYFKKEWLV